MNRILGIDFGERRIGISISDSLNIIASPLMVIDRKKIIKYLDKIRSITIENDVGLIVVGLPITLKGTLSKQTEKTLNFINELTLFWIENSPDLIFFVLVNLFSLLIFFTICSKLFNEESKFSGISRGVLSDEFEI